jgi:hypothetical protein
MRLRSNQNLVTFKSSSFNTSERMPYFLHTNSFGDDLAKWLIDELKFRDMQADELPTQRDYGWYFHFSPGVALHRLSLTFIPLGEFGGEWMGCVERFALISKRARIPDRAAVEAVHRILSASSMIQNIQWHAESELESRYQSAAHFLT